MLCFQITTMSTVTMPLDAVARLTAAIGTAHTLPAVFDAALDGLRSAFGIERASILLFDPDGVMRFKAWRGLSAEYRAAVEGHTPWSVGQPAPPPVVVPNVAGDPALAAFGSTFDREGIRALAFFPIVSEAGVIGKFMLYRREAGVFPEDQVNAANAIGLVIGFALERTERVQQAQRERQRVLFALDAANMGTWEWELATQRVRWSENLERIHGLPAGTFTGGFESYQREIHPEDRPRVMASIERALRDDVPHEVEYRIVAPDGVVRWMHGRGRVERDDAGTPIRMTGVCMDIGNRRRVEEDNARLHADTERLLAQEETLRSRLTTLTDGSYRLLTSTSVEAVVSEALSLARRVIPADAYAFWRREDGEWRVAGSTGLRDAFTSARVPYARLPIRFDQPVVAIDVAKLELLAHRLPAFRAEGIESLISIPLSVRSDEPSASIAFYYRTRHQPSEVELRVAVALGHLAAAAASNVDLFLEAQQANRLKDEFLATLSHELRTPLNVIAGRTRMLATAADFAQAHSFIEAIDRNCQTLTRLVDDLLDVSRMTIGQVRLDLQVVDVSAVVTAATQSVQSLAETKQLALTTSVDAGAFVMGDSMRLQQIAWNLLTNAVKCTPPGGRIAVSAQVSEHAVILAVRDSGCGIAADALPHVFDMFWQAEPLSARRHGGLGLGLSIVKTLAELHGGSVSAESAGTDRGATFTVTFPRITS